LQLSFSVERITLTTDEFKQWTKKTNCPGAQQLKTGKHQLAVPISNIAATWIRNFNSDASKGPLFKITMFNGQQTELDVEPSYPKAHCISWLQLLPIMTPELQKLRINVAAGLSEHSQLLEKQSEFVTLTRGESLLVDIATDNWPQLELGTSVLDGIPVLDRLLRYALTEQRQPPTRRHFYLLTPKIFLVQESTNTVWDSSETKE
jgi:hypothetical protein